MTLAVVLGGSSFIGRHLCNQLVSRGICATPAARRPKHSNEIECDITKPEQVDRLLRAQPADWIISCVGATTATDPIELNAVHSGGTLNLLTAVAAARPDARVVLFGSAAEYGSLSAVHLPVTEDECPRPDSFFGVSKLAQTTFANVAARQWGLRLCTVRPFNVIGPGVPDHYFLGAFIKRLRQLHDTTDRELNVSNADFTRDFVDVRDVARAVLMLLESDIFRPGEPATFNIATGIETSILHVGQMLADQVADIKVLPGHNDRSRSAATRSRGDATCLTTATGWQPSIDWQQSVMHSWNYASSGP